MDQISNVMEHILTIVLSSVVIAEIFKAIFEMLHSKVNREIDYVIGERKVKRDLINEVYESIKQCEFKGFGERNIDTYLSQLKMCINFKGYMHKEDYYIDGHIWKNIVNIENAQNKEEFEEEKDLLLSELVLLHQFSSEQSKKEIRGERTGFVFLIVTLMIVIGQSIFYFFVTHMNDIKVFMTELLLIWGYVFFLPSLILDDVITRQYHYSNKSKRKKLLEVIKEKSNQKRERNLNLVLSAVVMFLILTVVFLLHLMCINKDIDSQMESENENSIASMDISENYSISDIDQKIGNGEETLSDEKTQVRSLQNMVVDLLRKFYPFVFVYVFLTLFYILHLFNCKVEKYQYEEAIRKIRIEKNSFFVREIHELINGAAKRALEENFTGGKKHISECERMLVIAYYKLGDLKKYIDNEKICGANATESYEDVLKETKMEEADRLVHEAMGMFISIAKSMINERKRWMMFKFKASSREEQMKKEVKEHIDAVSQHVEKIELLFSQNI
ncbi:MAG: hypothetical protein ACI4FZ_12180 [Lachnospiraceae bacterium]